MSSDGEIETCNTDNSTADNKESEAADDQAPNGDGSSYFDCNICLETAQSPVVSQCGHLFCWPCLYTWLRTRPNNQTCPVCKSVTSRDKVVPIYGRGSTDNVDPRSQEIPSRPAGSYTESTGGSSSPFAGHDDGSHRFGFSFGVPTPGHHMSFGILFPFNLFSVANFSFMSTIQPGQSPAGEANDAQGGGAQELDASHFFMFVAFCTLLCLVLY